MILHCQCKHPFHWVLSIFHSVLLVPWEINARTGCWPPHNYESETIYCTTNNLKCVCILRVCVRFGRKDIEMVFVLHQRSLRIFWHVFWWSIIRRVYSPLDFLLLTSNFWVLPRGKSFWWDVIPCIDNNVKIEVLLKTKFLHMVFLAFPPKTHCTIWLFSLTTTVTFRLCSVH